MKLINKVTGEEIATIITNHSMTVDEAIMSVDGEIIKDSNDDRFDWDGENVIIGDNRYYYEDLDLEW